MQPKSLRQELQADYRRIQAVESDAEFEKCRREFLAQRAITFTKCDVAERPAIMRALAHLLSDAPRSIAEQFESLAHEVEQAEEDYLQLSSYSADEAADGHAHTYGWKPLAV